MSNRNFCQHMFCADHDFIFKAEWNGYTTISKACKYVNMYLAPDFLHCQCIHSYAITWNNKSNVTSMGTKSITPLLKTYNWQECATLTVNEYTENQLCWSLGFLHTFCSFLCCTSVSVPHSSRSDVSLHVKGQMIRTRETPERRHNDYV